MTDIKLDSNRDLDMSGGDLKLTSGADAIRQDLEQRLQSFKGNYFLDLDRGIPYFDTVFGRGQNLADLYQVFSKAILDTPRVTAIESLEIEPDAQTRTVSVRGKALGSLGEDISFSL